MKKIICLALVFALLTGALFFAYLKNLEMRTRVQYEDAVVAAVDIPPFTTLTPEMLVVKQFPKGAVHPAAARSIETVVGLMTESGLLLEELVLSPKLKQTGDAAGGLAYAVPEGMRAMTVLVGEETGVAWFLRKGDFVDILTVGPLEKPEQPPTEEDEVASFLVTENREVLATGTNVVAEDGTLYSSVTLLVTQREAQEIAYAMAQCSGVRLLLRGINDSAIAVPSPVYGPDMR